LENYRRIFKIKSTFDEGLVTFPWIVKNPHRLLYIQ
jgi:hypothetical protein